MRNGVHAFGVPAVLAIEEIAGGRRARSELRVEWMGTPDDRETVATPIGNAGLGALKGAALRMTASVFGGTVFIGVFVVALAWGLGGRSFWAGVIFFAIVAAEAWYFRSTLVDIVETWGEGGNWLKGGRGEMAVHDVLKRLPPEYVVFNDFHPLKKGSEEPEKWNVDHIVIGPSGVFVVETKNYSRQFVRSGAKDAFTKKNVKQVDRNARELKDRIRTWSAGDLDSVFVVPVLAYAQAGARVESLREGSVRVLPLRLLAAEIQRHTESAITMDKAYRLARVLYSHMPVSERAPFEEDLTEYGRLARAITNAAGDPPAAPGSAGAAAAQTAPVCPKCGGTLIVRRAKRGANAGGTFWACPGYPNCRHAEPMPA
jgi:hypothetical protein